MIQYLLYIMIAITEPDTTNKTSTMDTAMGMVELSAIWRLHCSKTMLCLTGDL